MEDTYTKNLKYLTYLSTNYGYSIVSPLKDNVPTYDQACMCCAWAVKEIKSLEKQLSGARDQTKIFHGAAKAEIKYLKQYKELFIEALKCVDRVFQTDTANSPPLLPGFCGIGEDKFEAVIKLAINYSKLKDQVYELEQKVDVLTIDQPKMFKN